MNLHIIPVVVLLHLATYISPPVFEFPDRFTELMQFQANIGNVRVFEIEADLGLCPNQYNRIGLDWNSSRRAGREIISYTI